MTESKEIKILIADDDDSIITLVKSIITKSFDKVNCIEASNGKEALKIVQEHFPDVVVLDLGMPVLGGLKTLQKIRELGGDYFENVPIIILTADNTPKSKISALNDGAALYFTKSYTSLTDIVDYIKKFTHKS